jgi:hypothetical protein
VLDPHQPDQHLRAHVSRCFDSGQAVRWAPSEAARSCCTVSGCGGWPLDALRDELFEHSRLRGPRALLRCRINQAIGREPAHGLMTDGTMILPLTRSTVRRHPQSATGLDASELGVPDAYEAAAAFVIDDLGEHRCHAAPGGSVSLADSSEVSPASAADSAGLRTRPWRESTRLSPACRTSGSRPGHDAIGRLDASRLNDGFTARSEFSVLQRATFRRDQPVAWSRYPVVHRPAGYPHGYRIQRGLSWREETRA